MKHGYPSNVDLDGPTNYYQNVGKYPEQEDRFQNDLQSIGGQFDKALFDMLKLVGELDIFDDGVTVAQDPTLVKSALADSDLTIGSGNTQVWYFPISAGVENQFRLVWNIDLFDSKDQTHDKFKDRLEIIDKIIGVKNLCLDGEYDSERVIEACEDIVSENWLIGTGYNPEREDFPSEEELPNPGDSTIWGGVSVGDKDVNLVAVHRYGEDSQVQLFFTNIEEDGMDTDEILALHNRRQAIETTIQEVKELRPEIGVEDRDHQFFSMCMATYLYNIYMLTKILYTPKYQLGLTPNKSEILTGVIEVCAGDYPKYNDGV